MKAVTVIDHKTGGSKYQVALKKWAESHGIDLMETVSYEVLGEGLVRVEVLVRDEGKFQVNEYDQLVTREVLIESTDIPPLPSHVTWFES